MNLASLLKSEAVVFGLDARDKKQALKKLASFAAEVSDIGEREIYTTLLEREHRGCTGMGAGVCIPHGRFESLDQLHALFARLDHSIDFGAPDGKKVDLVFLLLSPESANTEHIKALSLISKLLRDKNLCESLRKAKDATSIHMLLIEAASDDAA